MKKPCLLLLFLLTTLYHQTAFAQQAKIDWDEWGAPHITASNQKDLFFAKGWAEMQEHANLVLRVYANARVRPIGARCMSNPTGWYIA